MSAVKIPKGYRRLGANEVITTSARDDESRTVENSDVWRLPDRPDPLFTVAYGAIMAGWTVAEATSSNARYRADTEFYRLKSREKKRKACSYAKKYKAKRAPKCGCTTCERKFAKAKKCSPRKS